MKTIQQQKRSGLKLNLSIDPVKRPDKMCPCMVGERTVALYFWKHVKDISMSYRETVSFWKHASFVSIKKEYSQSSNHPQTTLSAARKPSIASFNSFLFLNGLLSLPLYLCPPHLSLGALHRLRLSPGPFSFPPNPLFSAVLGLWLITPTLYWTADYTEVVVEQHIETTTILAHTHPKSCTRPTETYPSKYYKEVLH